MTEMQKIFLHYTFIYYVIKGALCVALYIATVIIEKDARIRYKHLRVYLGKKRKAEQERWQGAYAQLNKRKNLEQSTVLNEAS